MQTGFLHRARRRARLHLTHASRVPVYALLRRRLGKVRPTAELAVVAHVFYPELWPPIRDALSRIQQPFDLYLTAPSRAVAGSIDAAGAIAVQVVPNVGRDVLPFLQVGRVLRDLGYTSVLKVHTKRDVRGYPRWRESTLAALLPEHGVTDVLALLEQPTTGVIGCREFYLPADAAGPGTLEAMGGILRRLRPTIDAMTRLDSLGFFAGTMFWARLDAISDLLDLEPGEFPRERGKRDGTPAHAVERLLGVLPQVDNKNIYLMNADGRPRLVAAADVSLPEFFAPLRSPE